MFALLGYRFKSDGKTFEAKKDHYARAAGHVTLYAALLQQSWVAHFRPPREDMQRRPVCDALHTAVWRAAAAPSTASRDALREHRAPSRTRVLSPLALLRRRDERVHAGE